MKKGQEIRELAERLGQLKERKWQLETQIKDLEAKLSRLTPGGGATQAIEGKILAAVDAEAERDFRVQDLVGITGAKPATIRAAVARLKAASQIRSEERGVYRSAKGRQ
jgi:hypothetical protein